MHPKAFLKLVFFFLIVERLVALIIKLPMLEQFYRSLRISFPVYADSAQVLRMTLTGPVLDIVVIVAFVIILKNERIMNRLSNWLAKD